MPSDFSKYELYTSCESVYCYENSNAEIAIAKKIKIKEYSRQLI